MIICLILSNKNEIEFLWLVQIYREDGLEMAIYQSNWERDSSVIVQVLRGHSSF